MKAPDFSTFASWPRVLSGSSVAVGQYLGICERNPTTARLYQIERVVLTPGFEGGGRIVCRSVWRASGKGNGTSSISFKSLRSNAYRFYNPPPEPEPEPEPAPVLALAFEEPAPAVDPGLLPLVLAELRETQSLVLAELQEANRLLLRLVACWELPAPACSCATCGGGGCPDCLGIGRVNDPLGGAVKPQ